MSMLPIRDHDLVEEELTKLDLHNGDVLVFRADTRYVTDINAMAMGIQERLNAKGVDNVLMLILSEGTSLETLDENQMLAYGWGRKDSPVAET